MGESITAAAAEPGAQEKAAATDPAPSPVAGSVHSREVFRPDRAFLLAFISLLLSDFAAALEATSLSVALPIISHELGGTAIEAFWAGTSFLLASTVFIPTFASASHTFGRKYLILLALVLFTVGSIVAAVARDFTTILAGRTVMGCGAGGMLCLTEVIITDLVPLRDRGTWFGYFGAVWAVGSVAGPLIGGALAQAGQWRWIFWLNLPICGLAFVAIVAFLKLTPLPGGFLPKMARFDWAGFLLLTAAGTSLLMPITWGNVMYPWSSWQTLLPLLLGVAGMVGFGVFEAWVPANPIVRLSIFRQRTALVNYLGTFVHGIILWSLLYYMPLYYECVKGYSPLISGVAMFPQTSTIAPAGIFVGVMVSKLGRFRWAIWTGWTLSTLGMGLLYLMAPQTTIPQWIFLNLVSGVGLGMLYNSLSYGTIAAAEEKDAAFAASMYVFSRAFGQSVGVAIGGAIFQTQFARTLASYDALADRAADLSRDAAALVEVVRGMPSDSAERGMIVEAYADSLKVIWVVMAGLAGLALMLSLFSERIDVNRAMESEQQLQEKGAREASSTETA